MIPARSFGDPIEVGIVDAVPRQQRLDAGQDELGMSLPDLVDGGIGGPLTERQLQAQGSRVDGKEVIIAERVECVAGLVEGKRRQR
jgi:hypothetical protein